MRFSTVRLALALAVPAVAAAQSPSPSTAPVTPEPRGSAPPLLSEGEASAVARRVLESVGGDTATGAVWRGGAPVCAGEETPRLERIRVAAGKRVVEIEIQARVCDGRPVPARTAERHKERQQRSLDEHGFSPDVVQQARRDLAARLNVPEATITVGQAGPVTFPDGSLGCPQPDQMYTQALVKGFRIVLRAGKEQYSYHGSPRRAVFFCAAPSVTGGAPATE